MNGEFLQGIGRGIFGEQEKMRKEQEGRDEKRKGQIIELLSSLAPNVEPESLPLLMGHLGDVIGIKGKMRKFWDVFSGAPDMSPEAQMGDIVRNVSSQLAGPETARKARAGGDMARLFQPQNPQQQVNRDMRLKAEEDLGNRIIFRDPRKEKLEELESRYGLQLANQRAQSAYKESLMTERMRKLEEERQVNRLELDRERADLRAEGDMRREAFRNARSKGRGYLTNEDWAFGAKVVSRRTGLDENLLRARIGLTEAKTEEAQATARSITETGMKPGEAGRLDLSRRNFYDDQAKEYSLSLSQMRDAEANIKVIKDAQKAQEESIRSQIATGEITEQEAKEAAAFMNKKDAPRLADEEGKLAGARTRANSAFNKLKDPENIYYGVGDFGTDIISGKKAVAPVKPSKPGPKAGIGTAKTAPAIRVSAEQGQKEGYQVGGTTTIGGNKYRIERLQGEWWILKRE